MLITHDLGVVAETCDYVAIMYAGRIVEYADIQSIFKNPQHPYTKGLMQTIPTSGTVKLKAIPGQPPGIVNNIQGCTFNPRCDYKKDICLKEYPEDTTINAAHRVKCHLLDK